MHLFSACTRGGISAFQMCVIDPSAFPWSVFSVFGRLWCCLPFLDVMNEINEELIPKKRKACWECSLYKAGRETFEEAPKALLFGYLKHAVHQTTVAPNLRGTQNQTSTRVLYLLHSCLHVAEKLTCPKRALAASKPPTWSLFLNRSKGYVMVLLITPAPLPHTRLLRPPRRDIKEYRLSCREFYTNTDLFLE